MSDTQEALLHFLDIFFLIFHFGLVIFNLFGWAIPPLRKLHLFSMAAIVVSWFGLGIFYGWGYCFLTDWHYDVRRKLDLVVDSSSYLHFLLKRLNMDWWPESTTNWLTGFIFGILLVLSILLNLQDYLKKKKHKKSHPE